MSTYHLSGIASELVVSELERSGLHNVSALRQVEAIAPLYAEQLCRFLHERGEDPPSRLADLLALRIERLSGNGRRLLQVIAVWGDGLPENEIASLFQTSDEPLPFELLLQAGLIERIGEGYRTAHPLLREVVLATIPVAVRKELHAACADLREKMGAPIEVLAMHRFQADHAFEALILLDQASGQAAMRDDPQGAISMLRRGLELARRELFRGEIDDPIHAVLLFSRKLGEMLTRAGSYAEAEGVLREALDLAPPQGTDRAQLLGALANLAYGRKQTKEAQAFVNEAIAIAKKTDSFGLIRSLEALAQSV